MYVLYMHRGSRDIYELCFVLQFGSRASSAGAVNKFEGSIQKARENQGGWVSCFQRRLFEVTNRSTNPHSIHSHNKSSRFTNIFAAYKQ
jgi:hypothetical protein